MQVCKASFNDLSIPATNDMLVTIPSNNDLIRVLRREGLTLEIRDKDGFVNATKLGKMKDKRWANYYRTQGAQDFLMSLIRREYEQDPAQFAQNRVSINFNDDEDILLNAQQLYIDFSNSASCDIRGTWVHREVAIDFARWISPDFAVSITGLVKDFLEGKVSTESSKAAAENMNTVTKKVKYNAEHHFYIRGFSPLICQMQDGKELAKIPLTTTIIKPGIADDLDRRDKAYGNDNGWYFYVAYFPSQESAAHVESIVRQIFKRFTVSNSHEYLDVFQVAKYLQVPITDSNLYETTMRALHTFVIRLAHKFYAEMLQHPYPNGQMFIPKLITNANDEPVVGNSCITLPDDQLYDLPSYESLCGVQKLQDNPDQAPPFDRELELERERTKQLEIQINGDIRKLEIHKEERESELRSRDKLIQTSIENKLITGDMMMQLLTRIVSDHKVSGDTVSLIPSTIPTSNISSSISSSSTIAHSEVSSSVSPPISSSIVLLPTVSSTVPPPTVTSRVSSPTVSPSSTIQLSTNQSSAVLPPTDSPSSTIQPSTIQPSTIQPSTNQSSAVLPPTDSPSSTIQPSTSQSSAVPTILSSEIPPTTDLSSTTASPSSTNATVANHSVPTTANELPWYQKLNKNDRKIIDLLRKHTRKEEGSNISKESIRIRLSQAHGLPITALLGKWVREVYPDWQEYAKKVCASCESDEAYCCDRYHRRHKKQIDIVTNIRLVPLKEVQS